LIFLTCKISDLKYQISKTNDYKPGIEHSYSF